MVDDDDSSFVLSLSFAINGYVEYALSESFMEGREGEKEIDILNIMTKEKYNDEMNLFKLY